jgi:tetratricopeptide (TPR) repeat protein
MFPFSGRHAEGRKQSMKIPNWRRLVLCDGVLAEPSESDRIVLWVRGSRENGVQYWQRISTAGRAITLVEEGIGAVTATALQTRQEVRGFFGRLFKRFLGPSRGPAWLLPSGVATEQCGDRQTDVVLVWAEGDGVCIDESSLRTRWPESSRVQPLGRNLFAVHGLVSPSKTFAGGEGEAPGEPQPARNLEFMHGVDSAPASPVQPFLVSKQAPHAQAARGQPVAQDTPRQLAEQQLQAARRQPDIGTLVTALTDLGIVLAQEGACQRAVELMEEALALVRPLSDPSQERDVLGNLGMALMIKDPRRALELLQQELALARGDPRAHKTALNHLGMFYLRTRMLAEAFAYLEEAHGLARAAGDRQHEAELLWLLAITCAEFGDRPQADAKAQAVIDLLNIMGKPQAQVLAEHLEKYRAGASGDALAAGSASPANVFQSEYVFAGSWSAGAGQPRISSSWLRRGFSSMKSLAWFVGSGMKRASLEVYRARRKTCQDCEHHTGLRCKLCGCFTSVKAWMPHEECPLGKWPG